MRISKKAIKDLLTGKEKTRLDPDKFAAGAYNLIQAAGKNQYSAEKVLGIINDLIGGYGVEYMYGLLYINMGETYAPTLMFDALKKRWIFGSWGDMVESHPARFR